MDEYPGIGPRDEVVVTKKRKVGGEAEGGSIRASTKPSAGNESCATSRNPFSGLPVEVLQDISAFLGICAGGGMWSYCSVIGKSGALSVREKHLLNNEDYLRFCLARAYFEIRGLEGKQEINQVRLSLREKIQLWMKVNGNWVDYVTEKSMELAEKSGWLIEESNRELEKHNIQQRPRSTHGVGTGLTEPERDQMKISKSYQGFARYDGFPKQGRLLQVHRALLRSRHGLFTGDWLIYAGRGEEIKPSSFLGVERAMKELSPDNLPFVSVKDPKAIFNNPRIAAELGLTEILRYLVEEKNVDPTVTTSWPGTNLDWRQNTWGNMSPVQSAFLESVDSEAFKYLSSLEDIDINVVFWGSMCLRDTRHVALPGESTTASAHRLRYEWRRKLSLECGKSVGSLDCSYTWGEGSKLLQYLCLHPSCCRGICDRFKLLVRHPSTDIDQLDALDVERSDMELKRSLRSVRESALYSICSHLHILSKRFSSEDIELDHDYQTIREMIQILLDAGANPDLIVDDGLTPLHCLERTPFLAHFRFKEKSKF